MSIDEDKAFDKVQYPFIIFKKKNFQKTRKKGEHHQLEKEYLQEGFQNGSGVGGYFLHYFPEPNLKKKLNR